MSLSARELLLFSVMVCLGNGCISRRAGFCGEKAAQGLFVPGKTTQRDVTGLWGNPDRIEGRTWTYREKQTLGAQVKLAYMFIGVTIGDLGSQVHSCALTFNERGVLLSEQPGDTAPQVCRWRLWPFD